MKCRWHLCDVILQGDPRRKYCSDKCKNKYGATVHYKRWKKSLVDRKGGKCERCGYDKCLSALCFHHLDPSKKDFQFGQNGARGKSEELINQELDKCILVCANCHAEVHEEIILKKKV